MLQNLPHLKQLQSLRTAFVHHGKDIRVCGGAVRDLLLNKIPNDIDLCTDATPEEQEQIYLAENIHYILTGLQHGTITVVIDKIVLEITSLRIDTDTNGRHAKVEFTQDWILDLSRRDFTINAMLLTLDGVLIDPFNGKSDLENNRVVFVGNPKERIEEDYLRILRWFRFNARYNTNCKEIHYYDRSYGLDNEICNVLQTDITKGLLKISRERVWSEIKKILSGPNNWQMLLAMSEMNIFPYIDIILPFSNLFPNQYISNNTGNPIIILCANYDFNKEKIELLASNWKWSNEELLQAITMCEIYQTDIIKYALINISIAKKLCVLGKPKKYIINFLIAFGHKKDADILDKWEIPEFPIKGGDIVATGIEPGPIITKILSFIKEKWIDNDYKITKEECLSLIKEYQDGD